MTVKFRTIYDLKYLKSVLLYAVLFLINLASVQAQYIPPEIENLQKYVILNDTYIGSDRDQMVCVRFKQNKVTLIYQHAGHQSAGFYYEFQGLAEWENDSVISVIINSQRLISSDISLELIEGQEPATRFRNEGLADNNDFSRRILDGAEVWSMSKSGKREMLKKIDINDLPQQEGKFNLGQFASSDENESRELSLKYNHALSGFPMRLELQPSWYYQFSEYKFDRGLQSMLRAITFKKDGTIRVSDRKNTVLIKQ